MSIGFDCDANLATPSTIANLAFDAYEFRIFKVFCIFLGLLDFCYGFRRPIPQVPVDGEAKRFTANKHPKIKRKRTMTTLKSTAARSILAALVATMTLPPTLILHSGGGFQAWWLFVEPWVFGSDEERERAAALVKRWQSLLRIRAAEKKWELDSTHDLARVLRPTGTWDWKYGEPRKDTGRALRAYREVSDRRIRTPPTSRSDYARECPPVRS